MAGIPGSPRVELSGKAIYGLMSSRRGWSAQQASRFLNSLGVLGIRYLDQGSRRVGEGTYNYVIFDESKIKITHENGQLVSMEEAEEQFASSPVSTGGNWTQQAILPMTMTRGGNAAPIDIKERNRLHRLPAVAFDSFTDVLERTQNPVGQQLRSAIIGHADTQAAIAGHLEGRLLNVLQGTTKQERKVALDEFRSYWKAHLTSKPQATELRNGFSPLGEKLLSEWEKIADQTGKKAQQMNVQVWDAKLNGGAGYRLIGNLGKDYFPRQIRDDVWEIIQDPDRNPKLRRQLEDALISAGWNPARARAFFELEAPKLFDRNDFFGSLEMARSLALPPDFYEFDFAKAVPRYIEGFSRRASQIKHFGQPHSKATHQRNARQGPRGAFDWRCFRSRPSGSAVYRKPADRAAGQGAQIHQDVREDTPTDPGWTLSF